MSEATGRVLVGQGIERGPSHDLRFAGDATFPDFITLASDSYTF